MLEIHPEHLNTPRLVADATGTTVWRWDQQEPFGNTVPDENPSGLGAFDLPLRLPGQYFDKETNNHYNYFRDYDPSLGIYKQSDLIGLAAGLNTYAYGRGLPVQSFDRYGLLSGGLHSRITYQEFVRAGYSPSVAESIAWQTVLADWRPRFAISQSAENANRHGMGRPGETPRQAYQGVQRYIDEQIRLCSPMSLGNAVHAGQDTAAGGHDYKEYRGSPGWIHVFRDFFPLDAELDRARARTREILRKYEQVCGCLPGKQAFGETMAPSVPPVLYFAP